MKRWIIIDEEGGVTHTDDMEVMRHYAQTDVVIDTKVDKLLDWQGQPIDVPIKDAELPEEVPDDDQG